MKFLYRFLAHLLTATMAASRVSAIMSAPTYPGVFFARNLQSKSGSMVRPRHNTRRILSRVASSGIPRAISRSKRPARRRAVSNESGRFVAPITKTCALFSARLRSAVHQKIEQNSLKEIARSTFNSLNVQSSFASILYFSYQLTKYNRRHKRGGVFIFTVIS